jgi:uncharacterized protein (TIGR02757 family)
MVKKESRKLKGTLERLYARYNRREFVPPDPLQFVYKYSSCLDKEIVAFLAAALAYGRVEQIERSLSDLLNRMGKSPYVFVRDFGRGERERLRTFKHRFTTGQDISDLLELLKGVLSKSGNIESYFLRGYNEQDRDITSALSRFVHALRGNHSKKHHGRVRRGLEYLLTDPSHGSACKRLNLFLRWMVRRDEVDPGLWMSIDKAKLIVPIDTHMARLCKILGFYDGKAVSRMTAVKITESFAQIEPSDPVKYDFALSRIGILEDCNGRPRPECNDCELFEFCR